MMRKNSFYFLIGLLLSAQISWGQSKTFISKMDTTYIADNQYIRNYDWESFFDAGLAEADFNVLEPDIDLLNASIFFTINKLRSDKKREAYKYAPELEEVAYNYVLQKSRRRLEDNSKNRQRLDKDFPKVGSLFDFNGKLQSFNIATVDGIDYKKNKKFYYDKKDQQSDLKLYYGEKKKDGEKEEIPYYTYADFAEELVSGLKIGAGGRSAKSKAYEYMGCYVKVDPGTLHKKRIPKVKAMIVYGGFRLKEIEEIEN